MFKLNLKIALRNLWKNKGYTLINIAGLSVGMASCILIFIFIRYQLSYDQHYAKRDRIYRVVSYWKYAAGEEFSKGVPMPLVPAMRNDFAMLDDVAALQRGGGVVKIKDQSGNVRLKTTETTYYVEPQFFKIFDYHWLQGDPQKDLLAPNSVALSEEMAVKFFGDWHKAVGQTFNYNNKTDLKVTAVFADVPENSSNPIKIAIAYSGYVNRNQKNWGSVTDNSECYILLKEGQNVADLEGPKAAFIKKYYVEPGTGKADHFFQPLADVHKDPHYGNFSRKTTAMKEIWGLAIIGIFLMLTACINFVNLATAQAVSRSKEVGVRKVMGSRRRELMLQFLTETITLTVLALLIACVITEATLPGLAGLFKEKLSFSLIQQPVILIFMICLVVFVGFLAGFYPAMVMSGLSPALAIKNKVNVGNTGGGALRKILVVVQFAITIILITGTLVVLKQMKFMREKPLGFNSSAIALPDMPGDSLSILKYDIVKTRILNIPGVLSASFCNSPPSSEDNTFTNFAYAGTKDADFQVNTKSADQDYFKTFGLQMIAGRALSKSDTIKEYVVNETLLKKLNIVHPQEAIGKMIRLGDHNTAPIVGVVRDFNNMTLRESISPILLFSRKSNSQTLAVKMDIRQIPEVMKNIEQIWNSYFPDNVYRSVFMDENINQYYESEQIMGTLFKVFASVIIFIAFIGLFGLISFVATQRTKEMAVRKVLGATTFELVKMLNTSFIMMVFIANLVAWPVAYIFISQWLSRYTYRIDLSIWPFVTAMLISMLVTLLTVSLRSYRAARTNPIDALKYE
ncbi:duplicated orphan permease [Pedobacter westerhofensis]|uniref:Duplicated orphan permease n=1 Tax=Pedobacter westerhofensis TaxID=425512 RepID=A0A521E779_9SPHI|nr:ABC transporter permease [Pedobacter westerhofensis]SMO79803.1 duplicated orphan permease [Pedobacter westerhofensis]